MLHKWRYAFDTPPPVHVEKWTEIAYGIYTPIPSTSTHIDAYCQSWKYFHDISGEIRSMFTLPEAVTKRECGTVAVHIRRGDYFTAHAGKHGFLDNRYFEAAMTAARSLLGQDVQFAIFSDDLAWCRQQPWLQGCVFVDIPNEQEALFQMSKFEAFIISNSTFSWWAAYLSGSPHVWAPDHWMGREDPAKSADVVPPWWYRVPA